MFSYAHEAAARGRGHESLVRACTGKTRQAALGLMLVLLAACGSASVSTPAASGAIQTSALVDVRTGESFTLTSFPGKVTLVEGFSVF